MQSLVDIYRFLGTSRFGEYFDTVAA
jgi:hypothetical protein